MKSQVFKTAHGTSIETEIELNMEGQDGLRFLVISTMKRYNGKIMAMASVKQRTPMGFVWMPFQDFNKSVAYAEGRATVANLQKVHDAALAKADEVKAEAIEFYSKEEAA